ncbi:hypothetical protein SEA_LILDESTINE_137 [Mycobacterium phage LilDestine]|nr:hypothetical protein SEA_LILDESTINE_137 [Mycobacterium phage LilDestine]
MFKLEIHIADASWSENYLTTSDAIDALDTVLTYNGAIKVYQGVTDGADVWTIARLRSTKPATVHAIGTARVQRLT